MAIQFDCPTCGISMRVPADAVGRKGKCKECGAKLVVPSPTEENESNLGYYQDENGKPRGPFSPRELARLVVSGVIVRSTLVRRGRNGEWREAEKFEGFLGEQEKPDERDSTEPVDDAEWLAESSFFATLEAAESRVTPESATSLARVPDAEAAHAQTQSTSTASAYDVLSQLRTSSIRPRKARIHDVENIVTKIVAALLAAIVFIMAMYMYEVWARESFRSHNFDANGSSLALYPWSNADYFAVTFNVFVWVGLSISAVGFLIWNTLRQEQIKRRNEAELTTAYVRNAAETHLNALSTLPLLLNEADDCIDNATRKFETNAFGPFWDSVEEAVRTFDTFRRLAESVRDSHKEYHSCLIGLIHNFPVLPDYVKQLPDPVPTLRRLDEAVCKGQSNFQFATIWEQRRTREALLAGFATWADAVSRIEVQVVTAFRAIGWRG